MSVQIWVDADACPVSIRQILFKAAERAKVGVTFIANQFIATPPSKWINSRQVPKGFDVADNEIVKRVKPDDLVVTQDIPLADEVISKGALALNPRGQLLNRENIKSRLNMRDFMETMRASGVQTGGPSALSAADKQAFANQLDRWLAKRSV